MFFSTWTSINTKSTIFDILLLIPFLINKHPTLTTHKSTLSSESKINFRTHQRSINLPHKQKPTFNFPQTPQNQNTIFDYSCWVLPLKNKKYIQQPQKLPICELNQIQPHNTQKNTILMFIARLFNNKRSIFKIPSKPT